MSSIYSKYLVYTVVLVCTVAVRDAGAGTSLSNEDTVGGSFDKKKEKKEKEKRKKK